MAARLLTIWLRTFVFIYSLILLSVIICTIQLKKSDFYISVFFVYTPCIDKCVLRTVLRAHQSGSRIRRRSIVLPENQDGEVVVRGLEVAFSQPDFWKEDIE